MRTDKREPLADDLRDAIKDSGLTLNEIERRCGVSHVTLSRFLRGQRTITLPVAAQLCELLGLRFARQEESKKPREQKPKSK